MNAEKKGAPLSAPGGGEGSSRNGPQGVGKIVSAIGLLLVALGCALYGLAATLVIERYQQDTSWRLAEDWDNSNCTCMAQCRSAVSPRC